MASYTPHYHLHQWEPEDKFLRTDFNEDFAALDAALDRAEGRTADHAYHLYNLMLQNEYEGKYTGYRSALLFDGFLDREGMAGKTGFLQTGGRLALDRTGQGDVALGSGGGSNREETTRSLLMAGGGVITGFLCYLYASRAVSTRAELEYRLTVNDETAAEGSTSFPAPAEGKTEERTISLPNTDVRAGDRCQFWIKSLTGWIDVRKAGNTSFPAPAEGKTEERTISLPNTDVRAGDRCQFWIKSLTGWIDVRKAGNGNGLGGTLRVRSGAAETGTMTGKALPLPEGRGAMAWVRHKGGAVALSLKGSAGTFPMTAGTARASQDLMTGTACTEQSFRLDRALSAGNWSVILTGTRGGSEESMEVFDYGLILL